jgi:hypothetical protein
MALTDHYRIACDEPGCKAVLYSEPLEFLGSERQLDRFYLEAAAKGWTRIGPELDEDGENVPSAHYCPKHRPAPSSLIF